MKRQKSTKRALLLSALSLLLCVSMLVGTTFAWFTDSVVSANNVIKSGNLDIDVQYTLDGTTWADLQGAKDLFQKDLWEPGHTEVVALKIENKGSLALKYTASMNIVDEIVGKTKENKDIVLSEILTVGTLVQEANQIGEIAVALAFQNENMYKGTTTFKASNILKENQELQPGAAHYVVVKVDMAETVGNEANHDGVNAPSITFGINVLATQYTYEEDSFGPDYDAGLDPEAIYVTSAQSLKDAMLIKGAKIVLNSDISIDANTPLLWGSYMFVVNGREVTIDMNGHSIIVEDDALLKTKAVFTTANGGTLNMVGEGTIEIKNGKSGVFHAMNKNDQINIYGGTYISDTDNGKDSLAILYTNSGNIDVYGGKFCPPDGIECANAEDNQGNRLSIVFHEGALLKNEKYYAGYDATRIQLAAGCALEKVMVDGQPYYQVVKLL